MTLDDVQIVAKCNVRLSEFCTLKHETDNIFILQLII